MPGCTGGPDVTTTVTVPGADVQPFSVEELAVRLSALPAHTGVLAPAVGVAGVGVFVTVTAAEVVLQPPADTTTV